MLAFAFHRIGAAEDAPAGRAVVVVPVRYTLHFLIESESDHNYWIFKPFILISFLWLMKYAG